MYLLLAVLMKKPGLAIRVDDVREVRHGLPLFSVSAAQSTWTYVPFLRALQFHVPEGSLFFFAEAGREIWTNSQIRQAGFRVEVESKSKFLGC